MQHLQSWQFKKQVGNTTSTHFLKKNLLHVKNFKVQKIHYSHIQNKD
jgi:hypothetical protein